LAVDLSPSPDGYLRLNFGRPADLRPRARLAPLSASIMRRHERPQSVPPVIELRRARALMRRHPLGVLNENAPR